MKWRKIIGWTLSLLTVFLVILCAGGYLFLKSRAFNQFARRKIAEATQRATGAPTVIGSLDFSLFKLTAQLHNITLRGTEPGGQPPLLTIDTLSVGLKIESVLHREVSLSELVVEHPVVHVQVDGSGASNLPTPPPSQNGSPTSVFDLAVKHAQLNDGEVTYNDKKTSLDADLYNLGAQVEFDQAAIRYSGSVAYDSGHVRYGEYAALPHSFEAKFSATPAVFSIESAVIKVGNSVAAVKATLSNYADPTVAGDYNIQIKAEDAASIAPAYRSSGNISLAGQLHYHSLPNQSALRSVAIEGEVASDGLSARTSGTNISVQKLHGKYRVANGALEARDIEIHSLGGRLDAELDVRDIDATPTGRLQSSLHDISLRAMQSASRRKTTQVAISGSLNGTAVASWTGDISKAQVTSDLRVNAAARNSSPSGSEIPVDGSIHATYDGARNSLTLRQSVLHVPSATLTAEGELSTRSNLQLQANTTDLHELENIASALGLAGSGMPTVSGSAALNATIRGSLTKPDIAAQLSAQNLEAQGSAWKNAQASVRAIPSQVVITNGALVSAKRGRASFNATIALRDWRYLPANAVKGNISVQQMSITELQRFANVQYPVSGDLSADIAVNGTQLEPQGSGTIQIANANAYGEPFQALSAQFHTDHGAVVSSLHVAMAAGTGNADLSYTPKNKAYSVRVDAPSVVLQKLHTVQEKNLALSGTVTMTASGEGTIDDPQLNVVLQMPQLTAHDKSISSIKAELKIVNHRADLAFNSSVVGASLQARAQVNLSGNYYTEASVETTAIPLDTLLAAYLPSVPPDFKGQTELHANLKGPLKDKTQLEAHLTIPTLSASYQSLQIGIAAPVHADFIHSVLTVQPTELRGTDTSLRVQGSIPFAGNTSPSLTAQGTLDVRIVKIFSPDMQSSGTVSFDIRASGTAQDPSVNGQVRFRDVAMLYAGAPLGVEKLNGTLDVGKESVQVSKLTAKVGGGDVSAGGSLIYRPALQFNLVLQSKGVRLRYPDGLRTLLDTNVVFSGNKEKSTLSGRVLIDSLSFTPDFDMESFANQFGGANAIPAQPGFADTISLAIGLQSKDNLSANSSQVSLEGRANLQVGGTAANPVITGRTDLSSGELFYRGVRYQLQRGVITFDDPNETNPVLNVSVSTTVEQYNLTLNLRGPFDKLTTSYVSDPPLPTADIINLIARGKTTQESASDSQSTDSMIASQAASQFTGSVQKLAGISSLQIDPLIGGNNQNPSARIAIQQRVTKNFLFTFSTDVSEPGSEVVQGEYQINRRWSVSTTRDQVGGIAVDGRLHTRF